MPTLTQLLNNNLSKQFDNLQANRFKYYSPEWYFAKYTGLLLNENVDGIPTVAGLTQEEALKYLDPEYSSWDGRIETLTIEQATRIHKLKYWIGTGINHIHVFAPEAVDPLMRFLQSFGEEETRLLIESKIKQIKLYPVESENVFDIIKGLSRLFSEHKLAAILKALMTNAVIGRAYELAADAGTMEKFLVADLPVIP